MKPTPLLLVIIFIKLKFEQLHAYKLNGQTDGAKKRDYELGSIFGVNFNFAPFFFWLEFFILFLIFRKVKVIGKGTDCYLKHFHPFALWNQLNFNLNPLIRNIKKNCTIPISTGKDFDQTESCTITPTAFMQPVWWW